MVKGKILVIDGDAVELSSLKRWLEPEGCQVGIAANAADAFEALDKRRWDLALVDLDTPGVDSVAIQAQATERDPGISVIMMTASPTVETAVSVLKHGAYDFIAKPLDRDGLLELAARALEHTRSQRAATLRKNLQQVPPENVLIGQSPAMMRVLEMVEVVAPTDAPVLIVGESGVGREMIARAIHAGSPRRSLPIVVVHCGALTGSLLKSDLFGQEPGPLPEAQQRRKGKFELAAGGTIFLDEVGELDPAAHQDVWRVLRDKEMVRLGGSTPVKVDFRCVAAGNRNLETAVRHDAFPLELYDALNTFVIQVPALRERREDIPLLATHFLNKYARVLSRHAPKLSKRAMDLLLAYPWPGNVRELENAIERALLIRAQGSIQPEDFPFQSSSAPQDGCLSLAEVERRHIEKVVRQTNWNLSRSARVLEIDRTTLYNKLKRYGLR